MSSSFFNLMLQEIRSAESSGAWKPVALLFFHSHLYNPPAEEMAIIKDRLTSSKTFMSSDSWISFDTEGWVRRYLHHKKEMENPAADITNRLMGGNESFRDWDMFRDHVFLHFLMTDDPWTFLCEHTEPQKRPKRGDGGDDSKASIKLKRELLWTRASWIARAKMYFMLDYSPHHDAFTNLMWTPFFTPKYKTFREIHEMFVGFCKLREAVKAECDGIPMEQMVGGDTPDPLEAFREAVRLRFCTMNDIT